MAIEPVRLQVTPLEPILLQSWGDVWFADFGKDAFANLEITFPVNVPLTTVTVRLGEKLAADGAIDRHPPGSVIFKEVRLQTRTDQRTYRLALPPVKRHKDPAALHMPAYVGDVTAFRYVEIEGSPAPLNSASLRQLFVHAPFEDAAAAFQCSDDTLNAVWQLCHHTMKATTAFGLYFDGERERIPYEADAYINQLSHYACDLDPRVARATFKHLLKHPTWPTEWASHMPMMAAADYQATGDPVLAVEHYEELKKKLLIDRAREDGLLRAFAIVDWPPAERDGFNDGKLSPHDQRQIGPEVNAVVNAFSYHALQQMALLATATGHEADAKAFEARAERIAAAFQAAFFEPGRGLYTDGEGSSHASLHANMFALAFGLVPQEHQQTVVDFVESRGMACSVYGAQYLLDALFMAGRDEAAVKLMTSRGERGWWHMIEQGSTMTLEAWNEKAKPNLTWNHAWGAAPINAISRYVLGVRPLTPGYRRILIQPQLGPLKWVRGRVPTPHGAVGVDAQAGESFRLTVEIPAGTKARIVVPGIRGRTLLLDQKIRATASGGKNIQFDDVSEGRHTIEVE